MTTTRIGIVLNPTKTSRAELEEAFEGAVQRSQRPQRAPSDKASGRITPTPLWAETTEVDAGAAAAQSLVEQGVDVVVAAGGDGTVRAVAEYLGSVQARQKLAIVAMGTGNLLARNLKIPRRNARAAFERVLTGSALPLDLGWVELSGGNAGTERFAFTVMAGFGIDANMITETDDDLKEQAGWLAYAESLGRAISASELVGLHMSVDGDPVEVSRAHTVLIGNCGTLPGGFSLMPDAHHADGELDALVLDAEGVMAWAGTLGQMVWNNGLGRFFLSPDRDEGGTSSPNRARGRVFEFEFAEPRMIEIDGENLRETTRLRVTVQRHALQVLQ